MRILHDFSIADGDRDDIKTSAAEISAANIQHQFTNLTKTEIGTFYQVYGKLKNLKQKFTREQLNERLTNEDFQLFKEMRNKITFWVKIGLGLSRQLEELLLPAHKTVPKPALLTTSFMFNKIEAEKSQRQESTFMGN